MSRLLTAEVSNILTPVNGVTVVVTVGNTLRSDDGLGPFIASQLESNEKVRIINAGVKPENLIDQVVPLNPKHIVIIDAADFDGEFGEARIIDEDAIPQTSVSTHLIPMSVISRILAEDTEAKITFIGVQPKNVSFGDGISQEVQTTANELVELIRKNYSL